MKRTRHKFWAHRTVEVQKGASIGAGTKIWHNSQVLKGAHIGKNSTIGHNCFISSKARVGNYVKLESNIDVWDLVTLEDHVFVGPSVVFTNDPNPRAAYPKSKFPQYGSWLPTIVKRDASIGANATILCGITIGTWAMVGAGAVVTKDVPNYGIALGVPAKTVGWICECASRLAFRKSIAQCKTCAKTYHKKGSNVRRIK